MIQAAINCARRLSDRLGLKPPVDIAKLVRRYANLESERIPFDIDGVCINLKVPGKTPKVIINSERPKNRRRFTLAHELGHLVIPWHVGTIIDVTDIDESSNDDYWEIESQANRFASEILMPMSWVEGQVAGSSNPLEAIKKISANAIVSPQAATIRLLDIMSPGHIVAVLQNDVVVFSGRSEGTLASKPPSGSMLNLDTLFSWAERWETDFGDRQYVWWTFPQEAVSPTPEAEGEWRDILENMICDLALSDARNFKASLNGIIGYANNSARDQRTGGTIRSACLQRLHSRAISDSDFAKLLQHNLFEDFLNARIQGLLKS
jgi:hypothetical protein